MSGHRIGRGGSSSGGGYQGNLPQGYSAPGYGQGSAGNPDSRQSGNVSGPVVPANHILVYNTFAPPEGMDPEELSDDLYDGDQLHYPQEDDQYYPFWNNTRLQFVRNLVQRVSQNGSLLVDVKYLTYRKLQQHKPKETWLLESAHQIALPKPTGGGQDRVPWARATNHLSSLLETSIRSCITNASDKNVPKVRKCIGIGLGHLEPILRNHQNGGQIVGSIPTYRTAVNHVVFFKIVAALLNKQLGKDEKKAKKGPFLPELPRFEVFVQGSTPRDQNLTPSDQVPYNGEAIPNNTDIRYVHDPVGFLAINSDSMVYVGNNDNPYREILGDRLYHEQTHHQINWPACIVCYDITKEPGKDQSGKFRDSYSENLDTAIQLEDDTPDQSISRIYQRIPLGNPRAPTSHLQDPEERALHEYMAHLVMYLRVD